MYHFLFLSIKSRFLPILLLRQVQSRYKVGISSTISIWFGRLIVQCELTPPMTILVLVLELPCTTWKSRCAACPSVAVCVCALERHFLAGCSAVSCCLPTESDALFCEVFVPLHSSRHLDRVGWNPRLYDCISSALDQICVFHLLIVNLDHFAEIN